METHKSIEERGREKKETRIHKEIKEREREREREETGTRKEIDKRGRE